MNTNNYKLLRFLDKRKNLRYKDIVADFIYNEVTLKPALNIEINRYEYLGLVKRHRGLIVDFDQVYITAKGMGLCRLLKDRDNIETKIQKHLEA